MVAGKDGALVQKTLTRLGIDGRYIHTGGKRAKSGVDEIIAMSRENFDLLVEATEDRAGEAAYHASRNEETFPAELVERIFILREEPIRVWREHRRMTQTALALAVGCSPSYLNEIEKSIKPGSLKIRRGIAAALEVDLDDLEGPAA